MYIDTIYINTVYINTICTQNYELKYTMKYITIAYVSKSLKLLLFPKTYNLFLFLYNIKIYPQNITFFELDDESSNN